MEFSVHIDQGDHGWDAIRKPVEEQVRAVLGAFEPRLVGIQVQLTDESHGHQSPAAVRCMIEVRPKGHTPVVVVHHAPTPNEAVRGASKRMRELLVTTFGRLDRRHPGVETIRGRTA